MFKAVELMQSSIVKVLKNLAVYIYKCFEIRNEVLLLKMDIKFYACICSFYCIIVLINNSLYWIHCT